MMAMNFQVDLLIELLKRCKTSAEKVFVLELFVQTYGPIPNNRADDVRYELDGLVNYGSTKTQMKLKWKSNETQMKGEKMNDDLISRRLAIDAIDEIDSEVADGYGFQYEKWRQYFCELPSAEPKWIPVTEQTLPRHNSVVVVYGNKGTWDYGTYRGHTPSNINLWNWKKNTLREVHWWMYKEDALPKPWKGEV